MYNTYESHTKISFHVTLFAFWVIYSNYQMLCISISFYYDNDSDHIWVKLLSFVKCFFTTIEGYKSYSIAYKDKCFHNTLNPHFLRLEVFSQSMRKIISPSDRSVYNKLDQVRNCYKSKKENMRLYQ